MNHDDGNRPDETDPFAGTGGKIFLFILICLALYGAYTLWLTLVTGLK